MQLRFRALSEPTPGEATKDRFLRYWPAYRQWFLRQGDGARPGFLTCRNALARYMPELVPTWEKLVALAGEGDQQARLLSLYRPSPYLSGCSQAVYSGDESLLVRNYDYHPRHCEAVILQTAWHGTKVIGQSDTLWGLLDGINEHGLSVSLAFGGRRVVGDGFGIPLVLRYVLEFSNTADEALAVLRRVPSHMAYNVHVLDAQRVYYNVHVSPDRDAHVMDSPVATNHQREIEWTRHAEETHTLEREQFLLDRLNGGSPLDDERFVKLFLAPPLYNRRYAEGFGTLYTAAYDPENRTATYLWPNHRWQVSFDSFDESELLVRYR